MFMTLKEKMIKHIQEITENKNADLWTLQFNKEDVNLTRNKIHDPYVGGVPIRINEDVDKEYKKLIKNYFF